MPVSGNDVIQGLQGGDTAIGGDGNDTFYFNQGDGKVAIQDTASTGQGNSIVFGQGITPDQISLVAGSDTLTLKIGTNGDEIDLSSFNPQDVYGEHAVDTFSFSDGTVLSYDDLLQKGFDFTGTEGEDVLVGTSASDRITGLGGDDILIGGPGNDILNGGSGNDTYIFNPGDGVDTIVDQASPGAGNTVQFGAGITANDLTLSVDQNTLVISVGANGDALRLEGFDPAHPYDTVSVENFQFADGTVLNSSQLLNQGWALTGTPTGNNTGTEGDDTLIGTSGADHLIGLGGDDVLIGGPGNDTLEGGSGNDSYIFNPGDGVDTIIDQASPGAGNVIQFGAGITFTDLSLSVDQNTLVINVGQNGDALRLEGFDPSDPYNTMPVDTFQFADGTNLESSQILDIGFTFQGTSGDDTLTGTAASNVFTGGPGNDTLIGGPSDDTYMYNVGDGVDTIDDQSTQGAPNMVIFGAGITPEDIKLSYDPTNKLLVLNIGTDGSAIKLNDFDPTNPYGPHAVEYYRFADGEVLTYSQMIDKGFDITGTPGNDTLTGTATTDRITGGDGNDTLTAGGGNDYLAGGAGDDTYIFNKGDGVVTIDDTATTDGGNTLVFGPGITLADMENQLTFQGNTLIIPVGTDGDEVHLTGFDPDAAQDGPRAVQTFEFSDGTILNYEELVQNTFIIHGTSGDDYVTGTDMTDRLYGHEGNDTLVGGLGNDTLTGGPGNDDLIGGPGSDCYVFHVGDGVDTITDSITDTSAFTDGNMIYFADSSITKDSISANLDGTTLTIQYDNQGDQIVIPNFDYNTQHVVETIQFSDNSQIELTSLVDPATDGDDVIYGTYYADFIDAKGGNDTVTTYDGNDTVYGGTGNDTIDAGPGDDLIVGGPGNDTLIGGSGNDTYAFNIGDGVDTITDTAPLGEGNLISFGQGITKNDITTQINGSTLDVQYDSQGDEIQLLNYDFNQQNGSHVVETLQFADGTTMRLSDLVDPATDGDDLILGSYFDDNINGKGGNDTIYGYEGEDTLYGGTGNDFLDGGAGADSLVGGTGDDTYVVDNPGDVVIENPDEGTDTVQSSISYTLPANVENLILTGADSINGTGNELNNVITGNSGDNVLDGGAGADTLIGGQGNDTYIVDNPGDVITENPNEGIDTVQSSITYALTANVENLTLTGTDSINGSGNELNNTIIGNSGDNILDGGAGADTLAGGTGNDTYIVDDPGDVVTENLDEGIDTVQSSITYTLGASVEDLVLTGTADIDGTGNELDNVLTGNSGANVLTGGDGNDTLAGGLGNDTLVGGAGSDTYIFNLGDGVDTVIDTAVPGEGNAIQFGPGITLNDLKLSYDGNNLIISVGSNGDQLVLSGFDPQDALGPHAVDSFDFADGTALTYAQLIGLGFDLVGTGGDDTIVGTNVDNRIQGLSGDDVIVAGPGNDLLDGGPGADTMTGGAGNDTYVVDNPGDVVVENPNEGIDTVQTSITYTLPSNVENLTLTGTDSINGTGNELDNVLIGNSGDNVLDGGAGADTMMGGLGNDTYIVDSSGDVVIENPNEGIDTVQSSVSYTLSANVENLTLTGTDSINGTGNDLNNVLTGNSGDNVLDGGAGADTLIGGQGNDTYIVDNPGDTVIENSDEGVDTVQSSVTYSLPTNVENLMLTGTGAINGTGNDLDNVITGNSSDNMLDGGAGADTMIGGAGTDTYVVDDPGDLVVENPSEGTDTVLSSITYTLPANVENLTLTGTASINGTGNELNNVIIGNTGDNVLTGGPGNDTIYGGSGNDTYVYNLGDGLDTISDTGGSDTIQFGQGISRKISCSYRCRRSAY